MNNLQKPHVKLPLQSNMITNRWESKPIRNLIPGLVGFDTFFDLMDKALAGETTFKGENYPPRNVIRYDDNNWEVQFAVAGFSKENLTITIEGNQLLVKGKVPSVETQEGQFLFHGIGLRDFEHIITFPENATITPSLKDGLLKISISKPVQESSSQQLEIL